jgi:hypothetical protein
VSDKAQGLKVKVKYTQKDFNCEDDDTDGTEEALPCISTILEPAAKLVLLNLVRYNSATSC